MGHYQNARPLEVTNSGKITRSTKDKTGLRVASMNSQLDQYGFRW
jgi:hypothetical protein